MAAVSWSSDKVKTMFLNPSPTDDSDSPTIPGTSTSPSAGSGDDQIDGKKSNNVGAIAGGVVAGVVGLALLAGLLFYLMRKAKRNKAAGVDSEYSVVGREAGYQHPIRPFPAANKELATVEKPVEVYVAPGELPSDNNHHWELDAADTQVDRIERQRYA